MIACCLLIPLADESRRLAWECQKLRIDLEHLTRQVEVNDEFIKRVGSDPALSERLAQRQMKFIRKGASVLELDEHRSEERSPFSLVRVAPPPPLPPCQPVPGRLAELCRDHHKRLYLLGGGLMLVGLGLVLGYGRQA